MTPTKSKAKELIQKALNQILDLKQTRPDTGDFKQWRRNTRVAIGHVFGDKSKQVKEFEEINYEIPYGNYIASVSGQSQAQHDQAKQARYSSGLEDVTALLESMLDEIDLVYPDSLTIEETSTLNYKNGQFSDEVLDAVCKALGDTDKGLTGSEIGDMLCQCQIEDINRSATKSYRLYSALKNHSTPEDVYAATIDFIRKVMMPVKFSNKPDRYLVLRPNLNRALSFAGLKVDKAGRLINISPAVTIDDAISKAKDLQYPQDETLQSSTTESTNINGHITSKEIFVVHGRDEGTRAIVTGFLEKLDLTPIVLQEEPNEGRTIIEKFEDHAQVGFAVVLCTPEDEGRLVGETYLKYRPRQNVVLELGFFLGKIGRNRVAVLIKGDVEIPSDYSGVLYIPMDVSGGWKMRLAKEFKTAGLPIDLNRL